MNASAFVTHGRKYHTDSNCPLLHSGEDLHDYEGDSDYGGGFTAGTYRRTTTVGYAAGCGKLPCLHCVPAEHRTFPPLHGQTFGHEPMDVITNGRLRAVECCRCLIAWPCTSAIVLGLVERGAA